MLADFERKTRKPVSFLTVGRRIILVAFLWLILVPAAAAQKIPKDGETIPAGTLVTAPCSCEGNFCTLWPLPERYHPGDHFDQKKTTSFIDNGTLIEGQWTSITGVLGGATVTEPWHGGRCVRLEAGGSRTDDPPMPISITYPGTYRLRIVTEEFHQVYVFPREGVSCAACWDQKYDVKTEDRYFYVVETAKRCDKHNPCPEGSFCKGDFSESPFTYFYCCPKGSIPCNKICIPDTAKNQRECRECRNPCSGATTCCSGKCVDLNSDNANCGKCGNKCGGWTVIIEQAGEVFAGGKVYLNNCVDGECKDELKAKCLPDAPYPCATSCRQGGPCCMNVDNECRDPK